MREPGARPAWSGETLGQRARLRRRPRAVPVGEERVIDQLQPRPSRERLARGQAVGQRRRRGGTAGVEQPVSPAEPRVPQPGPGDRAALDLADPALDVAQAHGLGLAQAGQPEQLVVAPAVESRGGARGRGGIAQGDAQPPAHVGGAVAGDVAPGLAGGAFEELPQPASAATAIATAATAAILRFAIADLRSTGWLPVTTARRRREFSDSRLTTRELPRPALRTFFRTPAKDST